MRNVLSFHKVRGPEIIEDDFSGTELNTDIWEVRQWGNGGSYSVNNGITLTGGSGDGTNGPIVYTKKTFSGKEKKITLEYTVNSESGGNNGWRGLMPSFNDIYFFLIDQYGQGQITIDRQTGDIGRYGRSSYAYIYISYSYPYTMKIEFDCSKNEILLYLNGTVMQKNNGGDPQWTSTYAISNFVGRPIFGMFAGNAGGTRFSSTITNVKITIE